MAECLKTNAMRSMAIMFNSEWSDNAWSCFFESIKTGSTSFNKAYGMPLSNWLKTNPSAAEIFNDANAKKITRSHCAIIDIYDFSGIKKITDLGGGTGVLIFEILKANPMITGIVADIPSVVKEAKKTIQSSSIKHRCKAVVCDFFKNVPKGSDVYLMSNILQDWTDEQCQTILINCHKAMNPDAKLLILEMLVPTDNSPSIAKLLDLEMLVMTGGRERTEPEFNKLLKSAGFKLSRIIPTNNNVSIIECNVI